MVEEVFGAANCAWRCCAPRRQIRMIGAGLPMRDHAAERLRCQSAAVYVC